MANVLTMLRLLIIPVFIYFLARSQDGSTVAGVLFALATATDWLDGQIARRTDSVTEFGKLADPLADRLLIGSALVILLVQHRLPTPALMAVLVRDAYIMAGFYVLRRRDIVLPVILLGKLSTAGLMLGLLLAIQGIAAGVYVFWMGVVLSLASAAVYTTRGIRQFRRPRAGVIAGS